MVTIVSVPCHLDIPSTRNALYLVDTGFDIQRPILIRDGHVEEGRGGVQHRLVKVPHPNGALVSMIDDDGLTGAPELEGGWAAPRVLWALQRRERESLDDYKPWQGLYVFSPLELGHQDFEVSARSPSSISSTHAIAIGHQLYDMPEGRQRVHEHYQSFSNHSA